MTDLSRYIVVGSLTPQWLLKKVLTGGRGHRYSAPTLRMIRLPRYLGFSSYNTGIHALRELAAVTA